MNVQTVLRSASVSDRNPGLTFPVEQVGFIDFETSARVPITVGTYRYAAEADAVILAYALGHGPVRTVAVETFLGGSLHWDDLAEDFRAHHARVVAGEAVWAAWNAGFDKAIWNHSTIGFPVLQPCHIIDVMAQAVASGLPADLAGAAQASGSIPKEETGSELIKLFCLPGAAGTPATHPEQWRAFRRYAEGDIQSLRSVFLGTRQLPLAEWREYWALEAINERGIAIDLAMVGHAARLAAEDRVRSRAELACLTGGAVGSVDQVAKLTAWLLALLPPEGRELLLQRTEELDEDGVIVQSAKHTLIRARVERLLVLPGLPEPLRRVLQIRLYGGSRTPAKFAKMLAQQVDGMLYGQYVFNGAAQTGRASSKGVQIHNLARDALAHEHAAILLVAGGGSYENLAACNPDPVARQLSLLIRPALVPQGDNVFVWSDWSQIEARILPWLAGPVSGAQERLDAFRAVDADPSQPDLYTRTAAAFISCAVELVTPEIRQYGKVLELALGFGGGIGSLQTMGAAYGLHFSDQLAHATVNRWRAVNSWCEQFWHRLETAATSALKLPGVPCPVGRLAYTYLPGYLGGSLICTLPSGRCLTYRDIRYEVVEEEQNDGKVTCSRQLRFSRAHGRVKLWRGMLCENAVQAVAADCLRETLVRLEAAELCVRATTHDEILIETEPAMVGDNTFLLGKLMQLGFSWTDGLPLMSKETTAYYYSKSKEAHGL